MASFKFLCIRNLVILVAIFPHINGLGGDIITNYSSNITFLIIVDGVYLSLNGVKIPSNGYVDIDDIGNGSRALYCNTDQMMCCDQLSSRRGDWYFPDETAVDVRGKTGTGDELYRDRASQAVRLNRRQGSYVITPRGLYRCTVPYIMMLATTSRPPQTISVNIGMLSRTVYLIA